MSTAAARLSISNAMRKVGMLASVRVPGLARAAASTSANVRYGEVLLTTMTIGELAR